MSKECKCTNPDGGGTKCPVQHVAVCIRGKDKECYGECVPIPNNYSAITNNFNHWLVDKVEQVVFDYARANYTDRVTNYPLEQFSMTDQVQGGKITFRLGSMLIHAQFSYEFSNDIEPLGGRLKSSAR